MPAKPYIPKKLPISTIRWGDLVSLIGKANAEIARYDGLLQGIINPSVLLSPLTSQEAVLSSRIEGTQATLVEVLRGEAGEPYDREKREDIREIVNYRKAMAEAVRKLETYPISLNMIKDIHNILLSSVRGKNMGRGTFRMVQNWIGPRGCNMKNASYIPPEPMHIKEYLHNWEKYIHSDEKDLLVQLAIVHAQFEIIHPFLDGNGRIGRMLVPLFLTEKKILSYPMFYISAYLEANRDQYYDSLNLISKKNNWHQWIKFFLTAVIEQAKDNSKKARKIQNLYGTMKDRIQEVTRSRFALSALDALFRTPVFYTTEFIKNADIPRQTGLKIVNQLKDAKIIKILKEGSGRRPTMMVFPGLLNITEGRKVV